MCSSWWITFIGNLAYFTAGFSLYVLKAKPSVSLVVKRFLQTVINASRYSSVAANH